jgi:hypothetical protein
MSTLEDDADGLSQINIWLQRLRIGYLSRTGLPRAGRPPLTLGPQVEAFLQKYRFASARLIKKHVPTTASTVKKILQRELGMRKFSRGWVPHLLIDAQKVAWVEAVKEMLKILQESEKNDFDSIATGDESWSQHTTASSKMLARSAADVMPRKRQAVGAKRPIITVFFTAKKIIMFHILPRGSTFNQLYFINMDNSTCHNGSKFGSKIQKDHISGMPHADYSPDISPCNLWLFGMLKQILRNRELS